MRLPAAPPSHTKYHPLLHTTHCLMHTFVLLHIVHLYNAHCTVYSLSMTIQVSPSTAHFTPTKCHSYKTLNCTLHCIAPIKYHFHCTLSATNTNINTQTQIQTCRNDTWQVRFLTYSAHSVECIIGRDQSGQKIYNYHRLLHPRRHHCHICQYHCHHHIIIIINYLFKA